MQNEWNETLIVSCTRATCLPKRAVVYLWPSEMAIESASAGQTTAVNRRKHSIPTWTISREKDDSHPMVPYLSTLKSDSRPRAKIYKHQFFQNSVLALISCTSSSFMYMDHF